MATDLKDDLANFHDFIGQLLLSKQSECHQKMPSISGATRILFAKRTRKR